MLFTLWSVAMSCSLAHESVTWYTSIFMLQHSEYHHIILTFHRPWYLLSLTFTSWWNCCPCSLLTTQRFQKQEKVKFYMQNISFVYTLKITKCWIFQHVVRGKFILSIFQHRYSIEWKQILWETCCLCYSLSFTPKETSQTYHDITSALWKNYNSNRPWVNNK